MEKTYCPKCKCEIEKVDSTPDGLNIYYCSGCKNRFIIDKEFN